jgi:hypothetical protein
VIKYQNQVLRLLRASLLVTFFFLGTMVYLSLQEPDENLRLPAAQLTATSMQTDHRSARAFVENSGYGVGADQVSNYCQQAEEEDNMGARKIRSLSLLTSNHSTLNDNAVVVLAEIARLERRIFPKHESLAGDFSQVQ